MSTLTLKSPFALVIAAVVILPLLSAPAFAEKKGAAPKQTATAHQNYCDVALGNLTSAEIDADAHAGTPAAAPFSKAADAWYAKGVKAGCWQA